MDIYGRLFDGSFVKFELAQLLHAQHLLSDGGTTCDCVAHGIEARNGKVAAIAFTLESSDPQDMHDIEINPDDVVLMRANLDALV